MWLFRKALLQPMQFWTEFILCFYKHILQGTEVPQSWKEINRSSIYLLQQHSACRKTIQWHRGNTDFFLAQGNAGANVFSFGDDITRLDGTHRAGLSKKEQGLKIQHKFSLGSFLHGDCWQWPLHQAGSIKRLQQLWPKRCLLPSQNRTSTS